MRIADSDVADKDNDGDGDDEIADRTTSNIPLGGWRPIAVCVQQSASVA